MLMKLWHEDDPCFLFTFIDNISLSNKEKQHNGKVLVQIKAYALKRTGYTLLHDDRTQ